MNLPLEDTPKTVTLFYDEQPFSFLNFEKIHKINEQSSVALLRINKRTSFSQIVIHEVIEKEGKKIGVIRHSGFYGSDVLDWSKMKLFPFYEVRKDEVFLCQSYLKDSIFLTLDL